MPDNPNTAEPQKPRRRWFQFRLRTMLISVVVFPSIYMGWQSHTVAHRRAVLADALAENLVQLPDLDPTEPRDPCISWIRRAMGDKAVRGVVWRGNDEERAKFAEAFPEARFNTFASPKPFRSSAH